jgi:hypothetical protein
MSCLDATFTLTPRSPYFFQTPHCRSELRCFGATFSSLSPEDFSSLYASDQFLFDDFFKSDPNLDYSQWPNRKKARLLMFRMDLRDYGAAQKQLALIFGFDHWRPVEGRVLVYSDAGLLQDQKLVPGDHQFLLELESVDHGLDLYFIHAGGSWLFTGLSGYVV